jgi:hypothetical protein
MEEQNVASRTMLPDIGRCFNDAIEVYKQNVLILALAAFLSTIIIIFTLLILAAPISGGYIYMLLKAMRRPDKKVELSDMFSMFKMFWPLFGLFLLQTLLTLAGFILLIIPGIFLSTVWMFSMLVMVDKNTSIKPSLKISWDTVMKNGFWLNFALGVICIAINMITSYIPFVGLIATFFISPFASLLLVSAYTQQVGETIIDESLI